MLAGFLTAGIPVAYQFIRDSKAKPLDDSLKAADIVQKYSDQLDKVLSNEVRLTNEIEKLKQQRLEDRLLIAEWQHGIDRLISQMESLNLTPVWQPIRKANGIE